MLRMTKRVGESLALDFETDFWHLDSSSLRVLKIFLIHSASFEGSLYAFHIRYKALKKYLQSFFTDI